MVFHLIGLKRYQLLISVLALIAVTSLGCVQSRDKKGANLSTASVPEPRWNHETGG